MWKFLSTPSARRATGLNLLDVNQEKFLSTPSARRATDGAAYSDTLPDDFYPRPPRGGRRPLTCAFDISSQFLSTPSARRATGSLVSIYIQRPISIHALREEGDDLRSGVIYCKRLFLSTPSARRATASFSTTSRRCDFYPRPPRGGRLCSLGYDQLAQIFLSTPSARRATPESCPFLCTATAHFYPRPPRGGRH